MMEQFREYDDEAARAGAPVGCRGKGFVPHVLKRAHGRIFGTVTLPSGVEEAQDWREDGRPLGVLHGASPRDLVMLPIDYIEGKPVWQGDIVYQGRRRIAVNAAQSEAVTGRPAPWVGATLEPQQVVEVAAKGLCGVVIEGRVVVKTRMSNQDLEKEINRGAPDALECCRNIANEAIARAIADGDVVPVRRRGEATAGANAEGRARPVGLDMGAWHRMEQAAAAMQAECVRQVMAMQGWTGTRDAADDLRKIDVAAVVQSVWPRGWGIDG